MDEIVKELTLLLMYLTSWKEDVGFAEAIINTKAINIFNVFWEYLLAHLLWITLITSVMPFFAIYHIREARENSKIEC